jgi:hypothetical protein
MIISIKLQLLTTMCGQRVESPSLRSNDDLNRLSLARFLYHTTYACLGLNPDLDPNLHISTLTQILQNKNGSSAT